MLGAWGRGWRLGKSGSLTGVQSQPGPARLSPGGAPASSSPRKAPSSPLSLAQGEALRDLWGRVPEGGLGRRGRERPWPVEPGIADTVLPHPSWACVGFLSAYSVLCDIRHSQNDQGAAGSGPSLEGLTADPGEQAAEGLTGHVPFEALSCFPAGPHLQVATPDAEGGPSDFRVGRLRPLLSVAQGGGGRAQVAGPRLLARPCPHSHRDRGSSGPSFPSIPSHHPPNLVSWKRLFLGLPNRCPAWGLSPR